MAARPQPPFDAHRHVVGTAALLTLTLALACAAPAQATTATFSYTGAEQTITVPVGVYSVRALAIGGRGGAGDLAGGAAARVSGQLEVSPGQTLYVEVGGDGQNAEPSGGGGGFNGGGAAGGPLGGGGGGASDVRTAPRAAGLSPDSRLIVAAGGGGTGGGGSIGAGGAGGAAGAGGEESPSSGNQGGKEGTQEIGGSGGSGAGGVGVEGELGLGGSGGSGSSSEGGPGGGGGGGYYGGGGGGGGATFGGGGGGGGSSLEPPSGTLELASLTSEPQVQITYNPPPSVAISFPMSGGTYTQGQPASAIFFCYPGEATSLKLCAGTVPNAAPFDTSTLGQHTFTVAAEDSDGGKAIKSVAYTVVAPPVPPETFIDSHPKKVTKIAKKKAKVKFSFSSEATGTTFRCELDGSAFVPCASPKTYEVKPGRHAFIVEAVNSVGIDPTPATFRFKVKRTR